MANKNLIQDALVSFLMAGLLLFNSFSGFSQCSPPATPGAISGLANACPGQTKSYSVSAVSGATSYTWTLPAGCNISGANPYTGASTSVSVVFGGAFVPPGNMTVKANNACGSSAASSKTLSTYYPGLSGISGTDKACPGDVINYHVTSESGVTYTWIAPAGVTITSGQGTSSINATFGAGFTSGNLRVAGSYGCGNGSERTLALSRNNPVIPSVITGSIEACPNTIHAYSITPRSGETYNWSLTGSTITGQGTPNASVTFPSNFVAAYLNVTSQNACGTSAARTLLVRANPPVPGAISGTKSGICNSSQTYSIAAVPTATSYTWIAPAGSTITSGQGTSSVTISFPSTVSGYVQVNATNNCGTSAYSNLAVTGSIVIKTQPQNITDCEDDTTTLSVNVPGSNLSYQWRKNFVNITDNADFSGSQTSDLTILKIDSLNAGYYDVVITSSCAPSVTSTQAQFIVNMKPPAPGAITKPDYACPGTSDVLFVPANGYNTTGNFWESLNNQSTITGGQGTDIINVDYGQISQSGYTFRVRAINGCGLSHDTTTTWIRRSIGVPLIYGPKYVCPNQTNVNYTGQYVHQTSDVWTTTPGITITSGQGSRDILVDFASGFTQGRIYLTSSNPCMTAAPREFKVYKNTGCRLDDESKSDAPASFNDLTVYPNPAFDKVNLSFNSPANGSLLINITDIYGKNVLAKTEVTEEGFNKIPVDLTKINKGLYIVTLKSAGMVYQTKITIEK